MAILRSFSVFLLVSSILDCGGNAENLAPTNSPAMAALASSRGPHVVLISIDALKPEYFLDDATSGRPLAKIPNLRALMKNGEYGVLESVWPTVTYPSHTTMVTGVNPSRHGILANGPIDPLANNQGGWNWYAEAITAPTLWDLAHAHHETVGAVYWPVTVGASIDFNFPQVWRAKNQEDDKLMRALSTPPGMAQEEEREMHSLPSEARDDSSRGDAADWILRKYSPNLMLVYYSDLDTIQHDTGPFSAEAYATLEKIDVQVGRVVSAVKATGNAATTTFIVVSDHGFAAVDHVARPAVMLAHAGLIDVDANGHVSDWRVTVLGAGGTCGIFLKDPNDANVKATLRAVLQLLASDPANGIARVDDEAFVAKVEGFKGASFILEASPGFYFSGAVTGEPVSTSGDRGMHGYPPDHPDMHASIIAAGAAVSGRGNIGLVHTIDLAPTIAGILGFAMPTAAGHRISGIGSIK
ncbi:MAG: ectonucleotide pyrophosphatase/phosphodiesterase [Polyangiaceae bacterium]